MKSPSKYAVFILSHGRHDKVYTYDNLRKSGYTGEIYIVCDDEDSTLNEYKNKYGDSVIVFNKHDYHNTFDLMDNFDGNKVIVYARNACYDIARDLGLDYFLMYEDDYTSFLFRWIDGLVLASKPIKSLDLIYRAFIDALNHTNAASLAFAQGGDFLGGAGSWLDCHYKRKAMNTFLFKVEKNKQNDPLFVGRFNDDVNTYLNLGKIGKLFFQLSNVVVTQKQTQKNAGGNTEAYKQYGTYVKSFYSVMCAPSCIKISTIGKHSRIHHVTKWVNAVPKIISHKHKQ